MISRTSCVYCGERIPGAEHVGTGHPEDDRARRRAARLTCERHRPYLGNDPHYSPQAVDNLTRLALVEAWNESPPTRTVFVGGGDGRVA